MLRQVYCKVVGLDDVLQHKTLSDFGGACGRTFLQELD